MHEISIHENFAPQNYNNGVLSGHVCCRKNLQRVLKKQGLEFKMQTKMMSAELTGSEVVVRTEAVKGGKEETLACDVLLVCVGRRPYTDSLGLQVGVVT